MKINGLKHLNSNWYNSIMIRNKNFSDIQIDIKASNVPETIKTKPSFYEKIKSLNEKEKINEIIRYFLNYNKIKSLDNNKYLENYKKEFIAVTGSRELYLRIDKNKVDKEITQEIIKKYILDRNEFISNNINEKNIEIFFGDNETSYDIYTEDFYYKNEPVLSLRLMNEERRLYQFEEDFLISFINLKISNVDEEIKYKYANGLPQKIYFNGIDAMRFGDYNGTYITCSKFIIKLDTKLLNKIIPMINEHNNKIKHMKKLQLTFKNLKIN